MVGVLTEFSDCGVLDTKNRATTSVPRRTPQPHKHKAHSLPGFVFVANRLPWPERAWALHNVQAIGTLSPRFQAPPPPRPPRCSMGQASGSVSCCLCVLYYCCTRCLSRFFSSGFSTVNLQSTQSVLPCLRVQNGLGGVRCAASCGPLQGGGLCRHVQKSVHNSCAATISSPRVPGVTLSPVRGNTLYEVYVMRAPALSSAPARPRKQDKCKLT